MLTQTAPAFTDFASLDAVQAMRVQRDSESVRLALYEVLAHCPRLPLPGKGDTLERWRALTGVAALDLALVKLAEPHWDALAIMDECVPGGAGWVHEALTRGDSPAVWAVWAAEPPDARLSGKASDTSTTFSRSAVTLSGRKAWCSGADYATHALVTYWNDAGEPCLAAVDMQSAGISRTREGWHAVGMDASASWDVMFDGVTAIPVGGPRAYLDRPGFWHGGMGIAACWLGGAIALGERVALGTRAKADPHALAHLGAIDIALCELLALMRATALWVDLFPHMDAQWQAMRVRAAAERCASVVLDHAGRALGAAPLCREADVARLFADLPVFIRQSHAERDLAALGQRVADLGQGALGKDAPWVL